MRTQIQRAVMICFHVAIAVEAGACRSPPSGVPCGLEPCPSGQLCTLLETATSVQTMCVAPYICGNGILDIGEQCDDGNQDDTDHCLSTCKRSMCGDGKVHFGTEECDDGNRVDGDGCDSNCTMTACGNGVVTAGEVCDDNNAVNVDGCKNDCTANLLAYIKASNTDAGDAFGWSVALSTDGSTLAVGTPFEFSAATDIGRKPPVSGGGAVYVFTRSGSTWTQQAYIKASNTDASDEFGFSVALSADGSTLTVGAPEESSAAPGVGGDQADNSAPGAGAVYVFKRGGTTWSQQAYIKASNTDAGDRFGHSVALSADGSTLAVGADRESSAATGIDRNQADNSAFAAGAVYVFTHSGTTWSQQAYIKASNAGVFDHFGYSVALSADGSTLAVGAYGESSAATGIDGDQADNSAGGAGAVYVFKRGGTTWSQQAYIKASNTDTGDQFGLSVALSADGSTLAVGAGEESSAATGIGGDQADNSAGGAGAVYVLTRSGVTWSQQAYIKASNTDASDDFGLSVALSADGSTLAVGAFGESSAATGIAGDQADNSALHAGAVYVFARSGATWSQQAYIKASNTDASDEFGLSVALSADGTTLAVGAPDEASAAIGIGGDQADNTAFGAGAVYMVY